jgi:hypothetical protein
MQRWGRIAVLCAPALALLPGAARAQDVFAAGASPQGQTVSDSFSSSCIQAQKPNIFKQLGVKPLTCHAGAGLQDSQGQCMNVKGTTVIAHQGTECYYCTPNNPPVVLYIPMDQVQNASLQGFLCGESSVDPGCMAACSKEFSTTTTYVPPVAQPVVPALQNGQDTGDPCHPYYDLSTAAGIAAMQADAPRVAAACNASRCQHNPELTVCTTVVDNGQPGSKGVTLTPGPKKPSTGPPPPPPPPVDIAAVDKAMVPCLQAKLPYKLATTVSPAYLQQAIASAPAAARSAPFQQLPNDVQVILEASALALQVQAQHDMLYRRSQYPAADSLGYMTGWLVRCLADAGVQPAFTQSPFIDYNQFMQIPNSLQNHQAALFNQGFYYNSMGIEPLPLMPLPVSQPGTPLPALPPAAPLGVPSGSTQ